MKVNDPNLTGATAGQIHGTGLDRAQQTGLERRGAAGRDPSLGDAPDQVSISALSTELRALAVDSPERVARLEKLSADVALGRYEVNAQAVSHRLVEEMIRPAE